MFTLHKADDGWWEINRTDAEHPLVNAWLIERQGKRDGYVFWFLEGKDVTYNAETREEAEKTAKEMAINELKEKNFEFFLWIQANTL